MHFVGETYQHHIRETGVTVNSPSAIVGSYEELLYHKERGEPGCRDGSHERPVLTNDLYLYSPGKSTAARHLHPFATLKWARKKHTSATSHS